MEKYEEDFRRLVKRAPNDRIGNRHESDRVSAELFIGEQPGGDIVVWYETVIPGHYNPDHFHYETEEELRDAWHQFEITIEIGHPNWQEATIVLAGEPTILLIPAELESEYEGEGEVAREMTHVGRLFFGVPEALGFLAEHSEGGEGVWVRQVNGRWENTEI